MNESETDVVSGESRSEDDLLGMAEFGFGRVQKFAARRRIEKKIDLRFRTCFFVKSKRPADEKGVGVGFDRRTLRTQNLEGPPAVQRGIGKEVEAFCRRESVGENTEDAPKVIDPVQSVASNQPNAGQN